jgi:hypothetical protein
MVWGDWRTYSNNPSSGVNALSFLSQPSDVPTLPDATKNVYPRYNQQTISLLSIETGWALTIYLRLIEMQMQGWTLRMRFSEVRERRVGDVCGFH